MSQALFEKYKVSEVTNTRRVICTPCQFTRDHFFYIQEAGYLKSLKPHLSKRSNLNSYLFMIVLSGSGTVTYHDTYNGNRTESYSAIVGDCFFVNCMNEYTHISSDTDPWELMWIHFYGPEVKSYYSYFREHSDWHFHTSCSPELINSIETILQLHENRDDDTDILAANRIHNILTIISTDHGTENNSPEANELGIKLHNIVAYLNENYTDNISLNSLAENFYISKYYLSREFKKEYGTTIMQYLSTKKITHAKELLRYSTYSIEEIAQQCGITDPSYFNKVFKKLEGCTASEYRKRW